VALSFRRDIMKKPIKTGDIFLNDEDAYLIIGIKEKYTAVWLYFDDHRALIADFPMYDSPEEALLSPVDKRVGSFDVKLMKELEELLVATVRDS